MDRQGALADFEQMVRFQADYVKMLHGLSDYPQFEYEKRVKAFLEWRDNKKAGIMTFREKSHTSAMTGCLAPVHHTPWL
jgi:trimethylamine monooxygenase